MQKLFSIAAFFFLVAELNAQLPNSDIWLYKLETDKLGQLLLKDGLNITNRDGYDNQPSFSDDGKKIFYVSIRGDKQADIYFYDLKSKKTLQLTKTTESEYSPVPCPDAPCLGSVVVEQDSAQRVHFINALSGTDEKKLEFDSVGYYSFLNKDTLVYYKLTDPHSLRVYVKSTQEDQWLGNSPVRAFKAIDRHTLIYGLKETEKVIFYKYDFILHKAERYAEYPSLSEDAIWHAALGLIKSEEAKLLRYDETKKSWILMFDLSLTGIKKITRFVFDPKNKYLVVVNNL